MTKIIFVYNAEGGIVNAVMDSLHKIFLPSTYPCKLCALTHGPVKMKDEWKNYLDAIPCQKIFLHESEFRHHYPQYANHPLSAVFWGDAEIKEIISVEDLKKMNSLNELILRLKSLLAAEF